MIKKLKKLPLLSAILAFAAVFAVVAFVAGCGPSDSDESGDGSSTVDASDVGTSGTTAADNHDDDDEDHLDDEDDDEHHDDEDDDGHGEDGESDLSSASFDDVVAVWAEVMTLKTELDGIIASKELLDVHKAAFAIRDLVKMLPDKSHDLSGDAKADLAKGVGSVVSLAAELDEAGDDEKQDETEALNKRLQTVLDAIAEIYPEGALK
ncbi:MAG: hypothetical protein IH944_03215 [Armatimonadetes bacterium]|nr:hypothetical protein [Armatimonadota bacterium]